MAQFTALFDANVLYPAPLRDVLMNLATGSLFRAKVTDRIHDEWIRNVLRNRKDLKREQLERTRRLMNEAVEDFLIEDFAALVEALDLPDENDRHVLAAAMKGRADVIVTFNLKDFPCATLKKFGIEAQHPDEFISNLIEMNPSRVCRCLRDHRESLQNPPKTVDAYLSTLEAQGLPASADRLRAYAEWL